KSVRLGAPLCASMCLPENVSMGACSIETQRLVSFWDDEGNIRNVQNSNCSSSKEFEYRLDNDFSLSMKSNVSRVSFRRCVPIYGQMSETQILFLRSRRTHLHNAPSIFCAIWRCVVSYCFF